jgi:hypothetical protein
MGLFNTDAEDKAAHEAAYNAGRDQAASDSIITQIAHGIVQDITQSAYPTEGQSYIQGYHDQSTGKNSK